VLRLVGRGPAQPGEALSLNLYTGVSLFDARAHRDLPERGCLIRDAYWHWLARGERVMAWVDPSHFRDVGRSHWHYWEANLALLNGQERWPGIIPGPEGALLAPSISLGNGARVRESAVGAGAQIAPGVQVERSVIWPGARVERDLQDTILLSDGRSVPVAVSSIPSSDRAGR
jgi:NDP-sugar pyrophosphorylase family protein